MGWTSVPMTDLKLFFKTWKSKKDLEEKFDFSATESRHCFAHLMKLTTDFEFREKMGVRRRYYQLRTKNVS